jgi:outer membrane protein assembly factor BamB
VDNGPVRSDPIVSGSGQVHVSDDLAAYGLDATTGARRWRTRVVPSGQPAGVVAGPVASEEKVLQVPWGGAPDTGGIEWLDATTGAHQASRGGLGVRAVTLRDPWAINVFSGFVEGTVAGAGIGIDGPVDWGVLFNLQVGPELPPPTEPAVTADRVFVGIERSWFGNNMLGGWDLDVPCQAGDLPPNCTPDVKTQLDGVPTAPVVSDDETTAYVATDAGTVYAVDTATGAVRWTAALGSPVAQRPALTPSTLYVLTEDGHLVFLPAGGCGAAACSPTTRLALAGSPVAAPAVAGGVVYTASTGGTVEAFAADGSCPTALWIGHAGAEITGGPTIDGGRLLVGTAGGRVVSYAPTS